MTKVPGVKFTKDAKKQNRYVTFDLKHHGEALKPMMEQIGAIEETEFRKEFNKGVPLEEVREGMKQIFRNHFNNKL
jgi:hypothetical protein